jgi:hypothetical protein
VLLNFTVMARSQIQTTGTQLCSTMLPRRSGNSGRFPWRPMVQPSLRSEPAALLIAHPGHELRVFGWLATARPLSFVLTKGDGHAGVSRLSSTSRVLAEAGAPAGSIYGRLDDAEIYAALLRHDTDLFLGLLEELVTALILHDASMVVVDADEGYNPSHDVCAYLAAAAAAMTGQRIGRSVSLFDFPLIAAPNSCRAPERDQSIWLNLDDDLFARKMRSAQNYPEMALEVSRAVESHGAEAFRVECLRPTTVDAEPATVPFYEQYGDQQVAAGRYREVIRYGHHVAPIRKALLERAGLTG